MSRLKRVYTLDVQFSAGKFSHMDLEGFLDSLRYDRCKVVDWRRTADNNYSVTLAKEDTDFTVDRIKSFGLLVTNHGTDMVS